MHFTSARRCNFSPALTLRSADLGDRRHDYACQQAAADDLVLGSVFNGHALQRHLGLQLQNQLGLGSYRTAWMLCAKLRRAMVNPEREPLSSLVEADETMILFRTKSDPIVVPAGRSGVGKMLVAGAVEIDGGRPRRARLNVIEGFGKHELHTFVLSAVAPQTQLVTDDWRSYQNLPGVRTTQSRSDRWRRTLRCPGSIGCFQT
jgi:ISXO2-like transposase domain